MKTSTMPMDESYDLENEQEEFENQTSGSIDQIQLQNASVSPYEIERLIKSGLSGKDICFLLAIRASYGQSRNPVINGTAFCEKWGFKENDFNLAIARLHKKQIISAPVETIVQLELFPDPVEEDF